MTYYFSRRASELRNQARQACSRATFAVALVVTGAATSSPAQDLPITSLNFYGIRNVDESAVHAALDITLGEPLKANLEQMRSALLKLEGVKNAKIIPISFNQQQGLFIGIPEHGTPQPEYRDEPTEDLKLPAEVVAAYDRSMELLFEAIRGGHATMEDRDQGHALMQYPPAREQQLLFLDYSEEYFLDLVDVLHRSRHSHHRAVAATVLAYVQDKEEVVEELVYAVHDANSSVRNNAVRALSVMLDFVNQGGELELALDPAPFLVMLESLEFTDRNKGAAVLEALSVGRDPELFAALKKHSLPALSEMARWSSLGHALFSIRILARLAGLSDEELRTQITQISSDPKKLHAWIETLERQLDA